MLFIQINLKYIACKVRAGKLQYFQLLWALAGLFQAGQKTKFETSKPILKPLTLRRFRQ